MSGRPVIVTPAGVTLVARPECDGRAGCGHRRGMESNTVTTPPSAPSPPVRTHRPGATVVRWLTTTDHKTIGSLYLITSFAFFCIGGVMALL
ncbi:hypothetical protein ABZU23_35750, partial [Streptomyces sp. NPDC005301]